MKQWVLLLLSISLFAPDSQAQQLNIKRDFALVKGGMDTVPVLKTESEAGDFQEELAVFQIDGFYISKTCVSVWEYATFCKRTQGNMPAPPAWGWGDLKKPMVNVSYQDALEYCKFLTDLWGVPVRLPTKTEWEYASFGGRFVNHLAGGYHVLPNIERYAAYKKDNQATQYPVCITCKQPNELGIYNMWGNVWEWVDGFQFTPDDTASAGNRNMIIGGSFRSPREDMHSETTRMHPEHYKSDDIGFRVVISQQDWDRKVKTNNTP